MIGSQLITDRNRAWVQAVALIAMLLLVFLPSVGHTTWVLATYALSYISFLTIPPEERCLYNLRLPNKKDIKVAIPLALLGFAMGFAIWYFLIGATLKQPSNVVDILTLPVQVVLAVAIVYFIHVLPQEILYRGFFWGYLRKFKASVLLTFCIQAILECGAEFHYFSRPPFAFAWIQPILWALVYGTVAWKTRSLWLSALVHACYNSMFVLFVDINL